MTVLTAPRQALAFTYTDYVRVIKQADAALLQAQKKAAVAEAFGIAAGKAGVTSAAWRAVTGPVGWALLGVQAGVMLYQVFYSEQDFTAVKDAAAPPSEMNVNWGGGTATTDIFCFRGADGSSCFIPKEGGGSYELPSGFDAMGTFSETDTSPPSGGGGCQVWRAFGEGAAGKWQLVSGGQVYLGGSGSTHNYKCTYAHLATDTDYAPVGSGGGGRAQARWRTT